MIVPNYPLIGEKENNMLPRVSVVMSNYNGIRLKLLEESLDAILTNTYENLEVLLIDNASTDASVAIVREKYSANPRFRLIQNPVNMYSQGLNLGMVNATGSYVAFFNNDAIVENGYFEKFIKFLEKNPKVALAQGKLVSYFDHRKIDSVGETMDSFGNPITIGGGVTDEKGLFDQPVAVLSVSGSCSIVRKDAIKNIGLFDESYGIGYEDLDLSLRAWQRGYTVMYYPQVLAYHRRGATDLSDMVRVNVRWHFNKNRIQTMIKNFPISFLIVHLPVTLGIYVIAGLWEICIKRKVQLGKTRFTSISWIFFNLPAILIKRSQVQKTMKKNFMNIANKYLAKNMLGSSLHSFIKI